MKSMIKNWWILCFSVVSFIPASAQKAKHVILISVDGFRPDFYLDQSWEAPNLKKLKEQGVYAMGVRSVFPSVTYPAHTTIVTGANPARHGIYYNAPRSAKPGQWYWEESYIQVPTLWDAVKSSGLTSASVMWPVTVGAPINYNFPVRRADDDEKSDQLTVTMPFITPVGLIDEIQKNATGKLGPENFSKGNNVDITIGKMGAYIFRTYQPNLMALHFLGLDHRQHQSGRTGDAINKSLVLIDSMIGVVIKTVEEAGLRESTAIIITGDHGFVDVEKSFSPNILLAEHGLLSKEGWLARFQGAGGSSFLYLKDQNDKTTLDKVKQIFSALPPDQKKLFRLVERAELARIGADPEVALALAMCKGVVAGGEQSGELVREKKKHGAHGYFPDFDEINTGFIAFGAGIGKHNMIKLMGIQDIAPLISRLLDLKFHSPDGKLIPGILRENKKKQK